MSWLHGERPQGGHLTINLDALAANYRLLRERGGRAEAGAAIKADGYGLGGVAVARRLMAEGCRTFFVAFLDEALDLRAAGGPLEEANIYVLNGPAPGGLADHVAARAWPVLNTLADITAWTRHAAETGRRLPALLHFDTGMNRLGLTREEAAALEAGAVLLDGLELHGVMSHLAVADEPEHPFNAEQLERFHMVRERFPGVPVSLANSAGIFLGPDYAGDLTRPGIGLYGGNPFVNAPNPMTPVVTLEAPILQIRHVPEHETVGYGRTYTARRARRIATLPVGYADGYVRAIGNHGHVWGAGRRLPVVGRISMDLMTIDITEAPGNALRPGDNVELIGTHITVDEAGQAGGTFAYEMLTNLGKRYVRRYTGSAGHSTPEEADRPAAAARGPAGIGG
ncbi:MAG: alanine racemase [Alphaproteobacteria bacterium]